MFQRFASVLFGSEAEKVSHCSVGGAYEEEEQEEQEEDWILVDYLAEARSAQHGSAPPVSPLSGGEEEEEEEEEEDAVLLPSPIASPRLRYASCTSLNSTAETDPEGRGEEEEEDEEEGGFLRVDAGSLEESWFVTPPPCFTGGLSAPVLLETSPLENLLIEHPSMSVYAHHGPAHPALDALPRSLDLGLLPDSAPTSPPAAGARKEKGRRPPDSGPHRPETVQRRCSLHGPCYAAALSARSGLLQQVQQRSGRRAQPASRNALRRINMLRPPRAAGAVQLQQPSQRRLNF